MFEQGIAGEQDVLIAGKHERQTAGSMSRRVNRAQFDAVAGNRPAVLEEVVDNAPFRHRHAEKLSLNVKLFEQQQVGLMD